jgi:steroid delta-isomerase-like uncharacterized protein
MNTTSGEDIEALLRRYAEEIYNHGNVAAAGDFLSEDYVNHASSQTVEGLPGNRHFVTMLRDAFPDLHKTILDQVVEGDRAAYRFVLRGTHLGEFMGMPPSGREVEVTGIAFARVEDGKIVEEWTQSDMLGLMQQLGAIPA